MKVLHRVRHGLIFSLIAALLVVCFHEPIMAHTHESYDWKRREENLPGIVDDKTIAILAITTVVVLVVSILMVSRHRRQKKEFERQREYVPADSLDVSWAWQPGENALTGITGVIATPSREPHSVRECKDDARTGVSISPAVITRNRDIFIGVGIGF